jgi:hypothetical protein
VRPETLCNFPEDHSVSRKKASSPTPIAAGFRSKVDLRFTKRNRGLKHEAHGLVLACESQGELMKRAPEFIHANLTGQATSGATGGFSVLGVGRLVGFEHAMDCPFRPSCGEHDRGEVGVADPKNNSSGKKPYQRPLCTEKSISEVGALLLKNTVNRRSLGGVVGTCSERGVLLVEGYEGELAFLRQTARTPARQLAPFSIWNGEGWVEMQFAEGDAAPSGTFFLLDLRHHGRGARGLVESIGQNPEFHEAIPCLILVTTFDEFHASRGAAADECWQLRGGLSEADLAAAVRAFLQLCSVLAKCPPQEKGAPKQLRGAALVGKTNRG